MSLNGTLETFPLPDVLALLAATKKTGELQVDGGRGAARVWLDGGEMVAAEVPRATTFVDAVFEMLRLSSGRFSFDNDGAAATPGQPVALEPLLREAQSRLGEWRSIEAVVPSLRCGVRLAAEVSGPKVSVTRDQWRALVAVATGPDVEGVMSSLGLGEFDSCRLLKDLVQTGLVTIDDAPAERPQPRPASPPETAAAPRPEPHSPSRPEPVQGMAPGPRRRLEVVEPAVAAEPEVAVPVRTQRPVAAVPSRLAAPAARLRAPAAQKSGEREQASGPASSPERASGNRPGRVSPRRGEAAAIAEDDESLVHQLAELQGEPRPSAARRAGQPAAEEKVSAVTEQQEEASNGGPERKEPASPASTPKADEPINRGLLLKFLNSVRS